MNDFLLSLELQRMRVKALPVSFTTVAESEPEIRWTEPKVDRRYQKTGRIAPEGLSKREKNRIYGQRWHAKQKAVRQQLRHEAQLAHARSGISRVAGGE